ncbi:MAG: GtrA family protein [Oscillospiraceae bacterium]|jgi:putative flippase GtrA|nr:GtrA family protein [Oscillospiraceae bacterium]
MKEKIIALYHKHGESLRYLIIGGLTTLIDLVCFALLTGLGMGELLAKTIVWVVAVSFAFVGNKWIVFRSHTQGARAFGGEMLRFFAMRLATLVFSWAFLYATITLAGLNANLANLLCNLAVIVLNYILGKFVVFKKQS